MFRNLAIGAILACFLGAIAYSQGTNETFSNYFRGLPLATTPLVGNEMMMVMQNGQVRQVTVANVTNQGGFLSLTATDQLMSGGVNSMPFSIGTVTGGTTVIDCGKNGLQSVTNNGTFTVAAPLNDSSCILLITNGPSAGAVIFQNFSVGVNTGDTISSAPGSHFMVSIARINGLSTYRVAAMQ